MKTAFFKTAVKPIKPLNDDGVKWLNDLKNNAIEQNLDNLVAVLDERSQQVDFLGAVFTLSPFLRDLFLTNPYYLTALVEKDIHSAINDVLSKTIQIDQTKDLNEAGLMSALRRLKQEAHGLIALGDLAGLFTQAETCEWLTKLAETTLKAALRFLLREADNKGKITLKNKQNPEDACGLIVLGMGKLGARELNYSSDIDLIVFIDEQSPYIGEPYESVDTFSKMMRRLVRIMQERTGDGYVFRVDLRLRPDPGSTPLALPVESALHYYESRGQNWERAAMIKARPVAGDIEAGEKFIKELAPYVWRKYLDYAAIADVHSIKRQIHAHKGYGAIAVRGHNVKLGRGGIREIEFFVQTQQLIAGGRFPQLRGQRTVEMLAELCEFGWITPNVRDDLIKYYAYLRNVEHRIQMLHDEQTHILPIDDDGFLSVTYMMGYSDGESFSKDFIKALETIEEHYAALFEQEKELGVEAGNLVFTGEDDDPETLATLSRLGFERPSDICRVIRTWHFGRYRAVQTAEARERLTELTPALLQAFGATKRADEALLRFDSFLQGLPSGIQLFSLLQNNPLLLNMLVLIMSAAPRFADIITRKPHVFDGMLDPTIFGELPTRSYLEKRLDTFIDGATVFEDVLDRLRIFADEQRFLIGIRLLTSAIDGLRGARAFTDLADLMIAKTLEAVEAEFALQYGHIEGGRIAILGMGKLGSREMTASSDVDLILLYDHPENVEMSNGQKPIHVSQYYARLTQRLVSALSAPMGEGILYEVDLRLRPSGNKGPVAVHFSAFGKYQRTEAWSWEHMALTRARGVAGDAGFIEMLENEVRNIIAIKRDEEKIAHDVGDMRALIEQEKPAKNLWDFKTIQGGLIDLEFLAQYALLSHHAPFEIGITTRDVIEKFPSNFVDTMQVDVLLNAYTLYTNLSQIIRLCLNDELDPNNMPPGLADLLTRAAGEPDIARVESLILEVSKNVRNIFNDTIKSKNDIKT